MLEVQRLVAEGSSLTKAVSKVAESSSRSRDAILKQYQRTIGPEMKEDRYRTLKILSQDKEELLVDFLFAMSTLDNGRTTEDAIEFVAKVFDKTIDKHVVSRLRQRHPDLSFRRCNYLGKKRTDDSITYVRSIEYANALARFHHHRYFP